MRPILIPALIAAVLSVPALAATTPHQATGIVKTWNATSRILTLDSGAAYTLPAGATMEFQPGQKVHVVYGFRDGRNVASAANIVR